MSTRAVRNTLFSVCRLPVVKTPLGKTRVDHLYTENSVLLMFFTTVR